MEGYVKLYRKLIDSPVFHNERLLKVWIWCLLKASHKPREEFAGLQKISILPGQFIFGRKKAAEELSIPESTVWRYMNVLKTGGMLNIEPNNKFSVITIENWSKYQFDEPEMDSKPVGKQTTNEKQMDTYKNVKNKYIYVGEFSNVKLTEEELQKLKEKFPSDWEQRIEKLSAYIASKGKQYKSHYATILNWSKRDPEPEKKPYRTDKDIKY